MTWVLTICIYAAGSCGPFTRVEYDTQNACMAERQAAEKTIGRGYAICAPKEKK